MELATGIFTQKQIVGCMYINNATQHLSVVEPSIWNDELDLSFWLGVPYKPFNATLKPPPFARIGRVSGYVPWRDDL